MKEKETRTRNWTFFVYPDSAPENWREIIDGWHIEWVCSPLHDKDINVADGSPKKAHWHVLVMFGGVKSYEQVCELIQPLNCPIPQRCHNVKSIVRYFAHLDNPEKARYSLSDIVAYGGVDIYDLLKPSSSERYTYIKEMQLWCIDNNITEYADLFDYAMAAHFDDWYPLLCDSCTFLMKTFLASKRHKRLTTLQRSATDVDFSKEGEVVD